MRTNFELYSESLPKLESSIYDVPTAAAFSSANLAAGIVNQDNASLNQSSDIGVAVNPVTKKIYATNKFSNNLSVISGTNNSVEGTNLIFHRCCC